MSCTPEQYIDEYGVPPPGLEGYGHHTFDAIKRQVRGITITSNGSFKSTP